MINSLKKVLFWCKAYRKRLYIGCVFSFLNSIFIVLPVLAVAFIINMMLDMSNQNQSIDRKLWLYTLCFMIIAVMGRVITAYLKARFQESIGSECAAEQRIQLGDALKRVSLGYFDENSTGDLMAAMTTDLSFVEMNAAKMIDVVLNGYISVVVMVLSLCLFSVKIGAVCLLAVLASAFFLNRLKRLNTKNAPVYQQSQNETTSATIEYIRGMAVVKSFKQEGIAISGINKAYRENRDIHIKLERDYIPYHGLHLLVLKIASVLIVLLASLSMNQGIMELPVMLMLAVFSFVIFGNVEGISGAIHMLGIMDSTLEKLRYLEAAEYIDENGIDMKLDNYDVEFTNVSFGYDQKLVLNNLSFQIPEKTTTAIVGPSGSGKTTICSLIARFYDVNSGCIRIGGVNIKEMTCDSLLKNISMVFQNVYLFRDSIKANIAFGNPEATMDEIMRAAKLAYCHDFIMSLPDGYDTVIGDGGATLSGGEKQRISIARAILKDAPIIILDEATASIDPENEHLIQNAISSLVRGKTMIVIAHRLATIEHANQILVVNNANVLQRGTHAELLREDGLYKRFIEIRERAEGWVL